MSFLGATDTVTGSRYLIDGGGQRTLVDCGLFQGVKTIRDRNRSPLPVAPDSIDAVLLTHAHLDHSGYLPALVRDGFTGPIYATSGTAELCEILLPDSGYLLEQEAAHAASHHFSSHSRPTPIYTAADATACLSRFRTVEFDVPVQLSGTSSATFVPAGHILGASQIRVTEDSYSVHFTGDLGRGGDPLMRAPRDLEPSDVLVTESTYGDRVHSDDDPEAVLGDLIRRVAGKGGVVLIPAFAVGRTETILLHLSRLRDRGEIPDVPIYLNSPMAINAARIYERHPDEHRLDRAEVERMYDIAHPVRSVDASKLLNLRGGPMIIISASGMLTGGRILHHIEAYGSDSHNAIVLTGFQATGTRGAALTSGARTLRIFGQDVPIRAEVLDLDNLSAHADADELLAWMARTSTPPAMTYVTHGEPRASDSLRARIKRELGWRVRVPEPGETVDLGAPQ
ncbi:MBL fold metallo-hydrolase [Herbiconiux sp. VKM Ac-1786]|uniref:MBL fold metallo-hydrolase RNA specificity domain-containing protein n=1 Tax=Herbiconiux sp. VKM Ac-1786 TaxID=2783824 RepID=UPI00188CE88B|nr:MBL fold metallo-hydrolase [Herbiconiux sp. VKM Ac-1786]MBF4571947.1 MBL fold metallo-hydrolase [Herbiconiux sp. VKM Ac-1786]